MRNWTKQFAICCLFLFFTANTQTKEVDNFTLRHLFLKDARTHLNYIMNRKIYYALNVANDVENNDGKSCDSEVLLEAFKKQFYKKFVGILETYVEQSRYIKKHTITKKDSIYWMLGSDDTFAFVDWFGISSSFILSDIYMGTDKLGHFLTEGWMYFNKAFIENEGVRKAMEFGIKTEETYYGFSYSGVKSYADLVANYNGMKFWVNLLGAVEGEWKINIPDRPYIKCENNKFVSVRDFDFNEYVDNGWDEAYNCSDFDSVTNQLHVFNRLINLGRNLKSSLICPLSKKICFNLVNKYSRYAPLLLHSRCISAATSYFRESVKKH